MKPFRYHLFDLREAPVIHGHDLSERLLEVLIDAAPLATARVPKLVTMMINHFQYDKHAILK